MFKLQRTPQNSLWCGILKFASQLDAKSIFKNGLYEIFIAYSLTRPDILKYTPLLLQIT